MQATKAAALLLLLLLLATGPARAAPAAELEEGKRAAQPRRLPGAYTQCAHACTLHHTGATPCTFIAWHQLVHMPALPGVMDPIRFFLLFRFFAEAAIMRKLRQARYDTSASWAAEWLGWLPDNPAPHCTWLGISCRDGRVVSM